MHIISQTSEIPRQDISLDAQLSHLGIDSLMIWELMSRLQEIFSQTSPGAEMDNHTFAEAVTVRDLVRMVLEKKGPRRTRGVSNAESMTTL